MSSAAPLQPVSMNRSNISGNSGKNLPPKHPSKSGPIGDYRDGRGSKNVQGIDQGDSLDRMMKKSNAIPGLESHYSNRKYPESSSQETSSMRSSQRPLGRNEYAEELRKQIEQKKEIDSQMERSQRRSYSHDFTQSAGSNEVLSRGRHGGPRGTLSQEEYAASLKSQIAQKNSLSNSDSYNPRTQVKAYSAPEPTRSGRGSVPPGGHSSFSMRWEG